MNVAVVGGAGRWGRNIVTTLESLPGTSVAWVAGSKDDWTGWLTGDRRPDAVAIASPAYLHAEHALTALAAGLPAFVEKPLALTTADAERVRDEAARRGLPVVVDHIHLFNPAWRALTSGVAAAGGATAAESIAGNAGPFRNDVTPLWDWGAHDVALALDLFGPPAAVTGTLDPDGNDRVELAFDGGRRWTARIGSRFEDRVRKVTVRATNGEIVWDDRAEVKLKAAGAPVAVPPDPPLTVALREFLVAAGGGARPRSDAAFGTEVVRALSRCGPARPS